METDVVAEQGVYNEWSLHSDQEHQSLSPARGDGDSGG